MADIESNLPPAYVKDGKILSYSTSEELPNYEGLVGLLSAGNYIMHTWLDGEVRRYHVVHEGIFLDMKEVEDFYKGKQ